MKWIYILLFICVIVITPVLGTTYDSDGSRADVQAKIDGASAGDTVTIPGSSFTWTSTVKIDKAITLRGASRSTTTILDDVNTSGAATVECLIWCATPTTGNTYISNITFSDGPTSKTNTPSGGVILIDDGYAASNPARTVIQHCDFSAGLEQSTGGIIQIYGGFGVTSDCTFSVSSKFTHLIHMGNGTSWGDDTDLGTDKFWFVEACTVTQTGGNYEALDADQGAKFVVRHNTLTNSRVHFHGADSGHSGSTGYRGTRAFEIYANTITSDSSSTPCFNVRSGTGVIYDNTVTSYNGSNLTNLVTYRAYDNYSVWGTADGTNAWDANDAGNPFVTGTATSGTGLTMTKTGAGWTVDQWTGYTLKNTTTGLSSLIISNTSSVITFAGHNGGLSGDMAFSASDGYNINKVTKMLDMPGLGKGTNIATVTAAACDSAVEPIYIWGNDVNGGTDNGNGVGVDAHLVSGTHYVLNSAKPGYSAYTYPHPLVTVDSSSDTSKGVKTKGKKGIHLLSK